VIIISLEVMAPNTEVPLMIDFETLVHEIVLSNAVGEPIDDVKLLLDSEEEFEKCV
jgi:hypothetical protein